MSTTIVNGAPMTIFQGTDDLSTRPLVVVPEVLPTHLPKVYIFAKKGPTDPQLVVGDSRTQMYDVDSFDLRSAYATHATVLSNIVNDAGNSQMIQRLQPVDAGPSASLRLSLDILAGQVPLYQRNSDGSYTLDSDGLKIPTGTTAAGLSAKWVAEVIPLDEDGVSLIGQGTQNPGNQTDPISHTQSVRYPIIDVAAPYFGADGNNNGLRIYAPTTKSTAALDDRLVSQLKVYPFRMACVHRSDPLSSPAIIATTSAEQYAQVVFKPATIGLADEQLYIGDVFIQSFQNLDDPASPPQYGPFGALHTYDANVAAILALAYAAETPYFDENSDMVGGDLTEIYKFNIIGGVSSANIPYQTFLMVTSGNDAIRLAEASTVYALGGSDGTMNETVMNSLVTAAMADYADENSILMDSAKYPESIIYDSGFDLNTKFALTNFIAVRKDTAVILSTHDVLGIALTASQESSLAIALRTRLQNFPESDYFGTPVMRGMIIGRSGRLLQSQYTKRLPLTLEIARKASTYMGAGNGRWKPGFAFDSAPASQVTLFTDINVTFTPASVRNKDWDAGLNWVQSFDRHSFFFPALKTVYDNDTSVLNSFFTMMACVELEKVGERAWRNFTGSANLTNAQLIERVNQFVVDNTIGRFDDRFVIQPTTFFTEADIARGYSWSLKIAIYAPNMKTVAVLSLEAHRIDDLATPTA